MKRFKQRITGLGILGALSCHAVEIRNYDPERHDRFVSFPSNLAPNPSFYLGGEDWSGFGWSVQDPRKHFTLISPKHFVGARHFQPAVGQNVRFVNRVGVAKTFTVGARHDIANDESPAGRSDLFVGELTEVVEDEDLLTIVPVYNLAAEADYIGEEIVMSGRDSRAGINTIASVADIGGEPGSTVGRTRGISSTYSDPGVGGDMCFLVGGDSGGPSAVLTDGGFALVGTHSSVLRANLLFSTTYTLNDAFVPHYMERLDDVLEEDGYHVTRSNATSPDLSLSLTESHDPAVSSDGVTYLLTIVNSVTGEEAHNLRLDLSCDAGATFAVVSGTDWVVDNDGSTLRAVRGGLASDESSVVSVKLNLPDAQVDEVIFSAVLRADGSTSQTILETTVVAQSFASWSVGLAEAGLEDDPDGDGLVNLLEFALGRDGATAEDAATLGLTSKADVVVATFTRRIFTELLGLEVTLESSDDLEDWTDYDGGEPLVSELGSQLETVTISDSRQEREFFRIRATLQKEVESAESDKSP